MFIQSRMGMCKGKSTNCTGELRAGAAENNVGERQEKKKELTNYLKNDVKHTYPDFTCLITATVKTK